MGSLSISSFLWLCYYVEKQLDQTKMESKQKHFIVLTVAFAVIGVGLLVTSFATDNWVTANPQQSTLNATAADAGINTGNSSFGLFNGKQSLKYQTGSRSYPLVGLYTLQFTLYNTLHN